MERGPAPAALVEALVEAAGLDGPWSIDSFATSGWVNQTTIIRLGGERFVVRRYGWPFDAPEPFDRRAKEAWIHPVLAAAGVPVADVLAIADAGAERGALMSFVPGELLGVASVEHPDDDFDEAWHEAGAALRLAHGIAPPEVVAGFLTAGGVSPFPEGSFGAFHRDRLEQYASRLAIEAPELGIDRGRVHALAAAAEPLVDRVAPTLAHGDSNPWNVLVTKAAGGHWHLSAWLDWEFAWVGDPGWDHMRMAVQRFAPIGPAPEAWFDGYGGHPPPLNYEIAVLHFMLWKAIDHVVGVDSRDAEVALGWLVDLPDHLDRLDQLVDAAT